MAETPETTAVVEEFFTRQREMYAGGDLEAVEKLLAEDVVWHVPGSSPIAGDHRGREAVLDYFARRRALAGGAIDVTQHAHVAHADTLVQLADGHATLAGEERSWRTAGVYRAAGGRIAEAWLVPVDSYAFDLAWGASRPDPFCYAQRVRPQDCATSDLMGHPRLLELFEAAFIEFWREHFGALRDSLDGRKLTLAHLDVHYRAPVRVDDLVSVEVFVDGSGSSSISIYCQAGVDEPTAATCRSRYVCVDPAGLPTPWPPRIGGSSVMSNRCAQFSRRGPGRLSG